MFRALSSRISSKIGRHSSVVSRIPYRAMSNQNKDSQTIDWVAMKELHNNSGFSFPELDSILVQFNRRRGDKSSSVLTKEDFGRFLSPLGIEPTSENVSTRVFLTYFLIFL